MALNVDSLPSILVSADLENEDKFGQSNTQKLLSFPSEVKIKASTVISEYVKDTTANNLDGRIHPALNVQHDGCAAAYNIDTSSLEWVDEDPSNGECEIDPEELYKNAKAEEASFLEALKDFKNSAKSKYVSHIDVDTVHSIDQVVEVLDSALNRYKFEDVEGTWGRIRKAFRKLGKHEKAVSGWLGILPSQTSYMSVICGGLKVVLEAAAHLEKIRDEVFSAITEIPSVLNSHSRVLAINKNAKRIHELGAALYVSILHAISRILQYFRERLKSRIPKVGALQTSYGNSLLDSIKLMKDLRAEFDREAEICSMERGRRVHDTVLTADKVTRATFKEVRGINRSMDAMRLEVSIGQQMMAQQLFALNSAISIFKAGPKLEEFARVLLQNQATLPCILPANSPLGSRAHSPAPSANIPSDKKIRQLLLQNLDYDKSAIVDDVQMNIALLSRLSQEGQDRAVHIMNSALLESWINSTSHTTLVVNNNASHNSPLSSVSFLSAKLADAFHRAESKEAQLFVIHFFCAGKRGEPSMVANSLLAQLIKQSSKHCESIAPLADKMYFDNTSVKDLMKIFRRLVDLMPEGTMIFCIVDRMSEYLDSDSRESREDAELLVETLLKIGRRAGRHGKVLKFLFTAVQRLHCEVLEEANNRVEILEVPRRIPRGGGFKEMKWDMSAGQCI